MGANPSGQLGNGSTTNRSAPVQISTGVVSVSAGANHSLFIKTDGSLWAMGSNASGQLGDGSTTNRLSPVQIRTGVATISAGANHSLLIMTDGTLWAVGSGAFGQLGNDSTIDRSTPVQITTGVASISAGGNHSVFAGQTHQVTFELGSRSTRAGGGLLTQPVIHGGAASPPTLDVAPGWAFTGWGRSFSSVTADLVVTAQYVVPVQPTISQAPVSTQVFSQSSATLLVAATANAPLSYQWYRGESSDTSAPVPGATGPRLFTPALSSTSRFWVRVSNAGLSTDSPPAPSLWPPWATTPPAS